MPAGGDALEPIQVASLVLYLLAGPLLLIALSILLSRGSGRPLFRRRPENAAFWQSGASGRNLRNFISQVGGARRVLIVWVADGQLGTDIIFPLNLFPFNAVYGLYIDVALTAITAIERRRGFIFGERIVVRWGDGQGFEFVVSDPDALLIAVNLGGRVPVTDLRRSQDGRP